MFAPPLQQEERRACVAGSLRGSKSREQIQASAHAPPLTPMLSARLLALLAHPFDSGYTHPRKMNSCAAESRESENNDR